MIVALGESQDLWWFPFRGDNEQEEDDDGKDWSGVLFYEPGYGGDCCDELQSESGDQDDDDEDDEGRDACR